MCLQSTPPTDGNLYRHLFFCNHCTDNALSSPRSFTPAFTSVVSLPRPSPSPWLPRESAAGPSARASTSRVCRSTCSARSMLSGNAADMSPDSSPLPAYAECVSVHCSRHGGCEAGKRCGNKPQGLFTTLMDIVLKVHIARRVARVSSRR